MKFNKIITAEVLILAAIFFLSSGCHENPLDQISVFSGSWKIIMSDANSNPVREADIVIYDFGSFCNKILIYPLADSIYISGKINKYGDLVAQFGTDCNTNLSGSVTGNISQVLGLTYGSGNWSDTQRTAGAYGTWVARRY